MTWLLICVLLGLLGLGWWAVLLWFAGEVLDALA